MSFSILHEETRLQNQSKKTKNFIIAHGWKRYRNSQNIMWGEGFTWIADEST
jgi:hypothetical protein